MCVFDFETGFVHLSRIQGVYDTKYQEKTKKCVFSVNCT